MARDRLAALRAQKQGGRPGDAPEGHEMTGLAPQDHIINGNGTDNDISAFYAEVTSIQDSIKQFDANVSRISELHSRFLNAMNESAKNSNAALLDDLISETRSLSKSLRERIKALASSPGTPQDAEIRKNRTKFVQSKFIESLQTYQQVESQYRDKYKQRVERQFKIVKPEATPEEVSAVVNDEGGGQIFAEALTSSGRYGESRNAYREAQERYQDIRRMEQTLTELAQLFNDMSLLVTQQDETINAIQESAAKVEADTEAGLKHTDKAVESARSARKKRWICFILLLIILAIIGIVVGVEVGKK